MKNTVGIIFLAIVLQTQISAQNIINLANTSSASIDLNDFVDKIMTGQPVVDSSMWLNYTALVNPADPGLSIAAELASGQLPKGIKMYLEAKTIENSNFQNAGRPAGKVELSHMPKVIVENIKTTYTGSGAGIGHQLIITFEVTDFGLIQPGLNAIYLQFTLK